MCPIYDGKNRAVTGCVATAMAQVMAYYKHRKVDEPVAPFAPIVHSYDSCAFRHLYCKWNQSDCEVIPS